MPADLVTKLKESLPHQCTLDLSGLTLIQITGADALMFLQNQFSNDVAAITEMQCQLNAYCNPKGRMLALIKLIRRGNDFWLVVPTGLAEPLQKRLQMFVLRAKVCIEMKPETTLLGLFNGASSKPNTDMAAGASQSAPSEAANITRIPMEGLLPRQLLLGTQQALANWRSAHQYAHQSTDDSWRLCDILSGIPQVYPQTAEQFIPQMLNLDLIGGLSFTKGCYPGQEIVARLHYLGKPKQRMLIGSVQGLTSPEPGQQVYWLPTDATSSAQPTAQKVGLVVDAVQTGAQEYIVSATAPANLSTAANQTPHNTNGTNGTLRLGEATGAVLHILPLADTATQES